MPYTVTMPKLSPTMESGQIVKWHKQEGDAIQEGDLLIEVATDKATVEYQALDGGFLRKILIQEGQEAVINQPIAICTEEQNTSIEGYEPEGSAPQKATAEKESKEEASDQKESLQESQKVEEGSIAEPIFKPFPPLENYTYEYPTGMQNERILASPAAKKLAEEKHIDLSTVQGTGPNGRITLRDLEGLKGAEVAFHSRALPKIAPGSFEETPLTPMRKVIGKRLQASKSFIPHFYVFEEIVVDSLVDVRSQLKNMGVNVTFNDLITKAVSLALKEHPEVNSGYDNQAGAIIHYQTIDIAIAVSVNGGLITPIIRNADYKNVVQIGQEVKKLAALAKSQKLREEQYQGGSFTISNLGMYGIKGFTAIINPPQGAILAVGGIQEKPIVKEGKLSVGKVLNVTLSADHRIIDGAQAADFLVTLKKYLMHPAALIV